jgi:glycosyltransferase involved in cell wall biosynthesis
MAATVRREPPPVRSVCFITGCDKGGAHRYRCHHPHEQLALHGIAGEVLDYYRDAPTPSAVASADVIVLHRVAWEGRVEEIVNAARAARRLVVFDTDDLVFEPGLTSWVRVLPTLPPREVEEYHDGVRRYLLTLEAADCVMTSTPVLAEFAERRGKRAFVHRNALCAEQIALGERWWQDRQSRETSAQVTIGYFSGTNTHDRDFQEAAPALALLLGEHPGVILRIGGYLNLPPELAEWVHRIDRVPYVDWRQLPELLSAVDINVAPLEEGNPYCRAKSEVKYFEAGNVGVPTVASRIEPYQWAIRDGDNGFLASGLQEWHAALRALVHDAGLRCKIGARARADVLSRYTPRERASELVQTLAAMQETGPALRAAEPEAAGVSVQDRPSLTLNWIVPEPFPGSGGHTNIFRMVRYLNEFGHRSRVYVLADGRLSGETSEGLAGFVAKHFGAVGAGVHRWGEPVRRADAVVATHWTTAYLADGLPERLKKFYFVQDFEPYFYPVGSEYVRAENTYRLSLSCITLGCWLARFLGERYGVDADPFDFAVDSDVYFPHGERTARPPTVVFYARRATPRRGFELGREALIALKRRMPEARVLLFGDETREPDLLPFPYESVGVLSPRDLAHLYSCADVGLVLSLTNCSLIPLEMMACKCAVVDLKRETVEGVLFHRENALLAEPSPEAIADCVVGLLKEPEARTRLVDRAFDMVQGRTWERSARQVEEILLRRVQEWKARKGATVVEEEEPDDTRGEVLDEIMRVVRQRQADRDVHDEQLRSAANFMFLTRRSLPYRLYAACASVWRWLSSTRMYGADDEGRAPLGEIRGRRTVGQSFVADANNLNRIDVMIGTYARVNTRPVRFHLKESIDAREDLATVSVEAWRLRDRAYHSFRFPPQAASRGRHYYFSLSSPESIWKDAVTVWAHHAPRSGVRACYRNGKVIAGEVIFRACYQDQPLGHEEWAAQSMEPGAATPWWRLPAEALAEARRAGALAAVKEVRRRLRDRFARR